MDIRTQCRRVSANHCRPSAFTHVCAHKEDVSRSTSGLCARRWSLGFFVTLARQVVFNWRSDTRTPRCCGEAPITTTEGTRRTLRRRMY